MKVCDPKRQEPTLQKHIIIKSVMVFWSSVCVGWSQQGYVLSMGTHRGMWQACAETEKNCVGTGPVCSQTHFKQGWFVSRFSIRTADIKANIKKVSLNTNLLILLSRKTYMYFCHSCCVYQRSIPSCVHSSKHYKMKLSSQLRLNISTKY